MGFKKNDAFTAEIIDVTIDGNGVCKLDGYTVFVPCTAVGDVIEGILVKALKGYGFGIVTKLLTSSPTRIDIDCAVYKPCGGCCFRHINYAAELIIKRNFVIASFERIGKLAVTIAPIIGASINNFYRNKAQFPIGNNTGIAYAGFYAKRSHNIIKNDQCMLQPIIFNKITNYILDYLNKHKIPIYNETTNSGIVRHIYLRNAEYTSQIMVCIVVTKVIELGNLITQMTTKFPQIKSIVLNINNEATNVILGSQCITVFGQPYITDTLLGVDIHISPLSFYQVNKTQAEILYSKAYELADLKSDDILLDLYCGVGTIGLCAANKVARVIGVEVVAQAIKDAKENAVTNNINAEFICSDAAKSIEKLRQLNISPTVIIIDPPRKGCDNSLLASIIQLAPQRVVMISCNPATAARDTAILCDGGYKVETVVPVDMFPRTGHVECVCLLTRVAK